ncbi:MULTISPECIES: hypothetical protein [Aphanothece]|uniref:hypothetical protein n=1 Tax=Aphanothece TaxID=1121 RepID=UPI00398F2E85
MVSPFAKTTLCGLGACLASLASPLAVSAAQPPTRAELLSPALTLPHQAPARLGAPQVRQVRLLPQQPSAAARSTAVALSVPLPPPAPRIYAITPERRALLNTIRFAEGTWAGGEDIGYRIIFGGGLMPSLDRHPNRVVRTARYASAAAGAYQFMPPTWAMVSRKLGFQLQGPEAFGPQVQDQAALFLIQRRGALHLADQGAFTPDLAHRLAPEWASFPTLAGRSYYGQPVKRYNELRQFYEQNLAYLRRQLELNTLAAAPEPPPKPPCLPEDSLRCQLEALDAVGPRSSGV